MNARGTYRTSILACESSRILEFSSATFTIGPRIKRFPLAPKGRGTYRPGDRFPEPHAGHLLPGDVGRDFWRHGTMCSITSQNLTSIESDFYGTGRGLDSSWGLGFLPVSVEGSWERPIRSRGDVRCADGVDSCPARRQPREPLNGTAQQADFFSMNQICSLRNN